MSQDFLKHIFLFNALERVPRYKTIDELNKALAAEGFSRGERSVQRIMAFLVDQYGVAYIDKYGPHKRARGWAWPKSGAPSLGPMDAPTALVYEIAAQLVKPLLPDSYMQSLDWEFKRAKAVINQVGRKGSVTKKIRVVPRTLGRLQGQVDQKVLRTLYEALIQGKQVEIDYVSLEGATPKTHLTNPLGIITQLDSMRLVHAKEKDGEFLGPADWPIQRIKKARLSTEKAREPAGFDLDQYLEVASFKKTFGVLEGLGSSFKLEILLKPKTARYIEERPFSEDQIKVAKPEPDGRLKFKATVKNTRELMTQLKDFGDDAEVLKPPRLRKYFRELAKALSEQYGD